MSFFALDIGNTRLKWAQYASAQPGAALLAHGAEFLEHIDRIAEGAWAQLAPPQAVLGCVVAGDAMRRRAQEQLELWDAPAHWVVASAAEAGLINGYDHPTRLGADRWVAMIGAWHRLRASAGGPRPMLVVMIGTAVTVDAVDATGRFIGGLILPGHGIMLRALEGGTAGLHVPTGEVSEFPTNTSDALTSGGSYAITGAIERMREHLKRRCGADPVCYMTGGAGWKVGPAMAVPFELVESLIFDGLLEIAARRFGLPGYQV